MQRNNADILGSFMPKLTNQLTITNHKERHKNNRIQLTSEEIEKDIEEFLQQGGTITKLNYGVRRHVWTRVACISSSNNTSNYTNHVFVKRGDSIMSAVDVVTLLIVGLPVVGFVTYLLVEGEE